MPDNFSFDDAMQRAIIEYFFADPLPQLVPSGPDGQTITVNPRPSPLRQLVEQIIARNGQEMVQRVFDKIDLDVLADKLAEKLAARFEAELDMANRVSSTWNPYRPSAWMQDVDDIAKRVVAAELADRMMKTMEPQEAAADKETTQ